VRGVWYTLSGNSTPPSTPGGGIWGWGGVAVDPTVNVGGIYVATGNARSGPTQQPFAEYLVNLSQDLSQTVSYTGPTIVPGDKDYGSTPVLFQPTACGSTKLLAALNKTGILVVASVQNGVLNLMQSLQIVSPSNGMLIGNAAWDHNRQLLYVTTKYDGPPPYIHGLTAFAVDPSCAAPLTFAWQTTADMNGAPLMPSGTGITSPTIAARMVFFVVGGRKPTLYAVATLTTAFGEVGHVQRQIPMPGCAASEPPIVVNGRVFVACDGSSSVLYAFAIPGF
jgi:hypothetical protein